MKVNSILILMLALIYAGCKSNHIKDTRLHQHEVDSMEKNDPEGHNHEEVNLQLTSYSDNFELFAEVKPFVLGEASNILAHFSTLPDFTALNSGSVTVTLQINGRETSQTLDEPTRRGIYSFDIQPSVAGEGKLCFDISNDSEKHQLIIPHVKVFTEERDADKAADEAEITSGDAYNFSKEQSWKIEFATEEAKAEPLGQIIKTSAQVQSAPGDEHTVVARTNGIVVLSEIDVLAGTAVNPGQVLFNISGSSMSENNAEVRFREAISNYEKAKADFDRITALSEEKIVSEKELIAAKNIFINASATYENLKKNFSASGQIVASPIKGFITEVMVSNGQYVEAGKAVMKVCQNKTLLLAADIQQKYAGLLASISDANIRSVHNRKTYTLDQLGGKLLGYGRTTNTDNYLIPVHVQITNSGEFIPGEFVEIYFKCSAVKSTITVPNSALLETQGSYSVFVQLTPELFELRGVKTGVSDGLRTEIYEGLAEGERVVTKGGIFIKLAKATGSLDAHSGHVH